MYIVLCVCLCVCVLYIFLYIRFSNYWTVNSTAATDSFEPKEQRISILGIVGGRVCIPPEAKLQQEQKLATAILYKNECGSLLVQLYLWNRQQARFDI